MSRLKKQKKKKVKTQNYRIWSKCRNKNRQMNSTKLLETTLITNYEATKLHSQ